MHTVRTIFLVILFTLLVVVMVQNAQPIEFHFLNWSYQVSQLLLVIIVFVIGCLTGFIAAKLTGRKREDEPLLTTRPR